MKYYVKKPHKADKMYLPGHEREISNKSVAEDLIRRNLIYPNYKTKEDKEKMIVPKKKAVIEHDAGPMFFVKQGDKVIDRLKKGEAQKLADDINA